MKNANYEAGKWKITTIYCGHTYNLKGSLTVGLDDDLYLKIPYFAYLLQDGKQNILIDCGINERFLIDGKAHGGYEANAGSKDFLSSLAKAGLKPDDIDLILYTHLHNDHAGNCNFFPNTKSIAQKDEWFNLLDPVFAETVRRDYDPGVIPFLQNNKNFFTIEGDLEVMEGIRLITTRGHTKGSQSVVVNSVNGLRLFIGDHFHLICSGFPYLDEMIDMDGVVHKITPAPANWPTIPSSLIYDFYAYYDSTKKIRSLIPGGDPSYLVCGHDAKVMFGEV